MGTVVEMTVMPAGTLDLDWLARLHEERRLRLCTRDGGVVFVTDENPVDEGRGPTVDDAIALVTELLRLAHRGQLQLADDALSRALPRSGGERT